MSYHHHRYNRRHYYSHYYKRPYFTRRPYYHHHNPISGRKVLLGVALLFILLGFIAAASRGDIGGLVGFVFLVGIIVLIFQGIKKLFRRGSQIAGSEAVQINQQDVAQINSEKHGCKCYMEGLSDGEQEVADTLSRELSYKDYFLFNNLIIPSENNESTQIDHIVVSRFGIFVIESKDYNGWIFGDKDGQSWTQVLAGGTNKFQFQNPIHQNYAHIMALKALIPSAADDFFSIVVFSRRSEIKTTPIENVVHLSELVGCIKKFTEEKLTESELQLVIGKLSYACQTIDITASEHVENLHAHKDA